MEIEPWAAPTNTSSTGSSASSTGGFSHFMRMPHELMIYCMSFLEVKSISQVGAVCKLFYRLINENSLWYHFLKMYLSQGNLIIGYCGHSLLFFLFSNIIITNREEKVDEETITDFACLFADLPSFLFLFFVPLAAFLDFEKRLKQNQIADPSNLKQCFKEGTNLTTNMPDNTQWMIPSFALFILPYIVVSVYYFVYLFVPFNIIFIPHYRNRTRLLCCNECLLLSYPSRKDRNRYEGLW